MTPELSRRLANAMTLGDATIDERDRIRDAVAGDVSGIDDLPDDVRRLVLDLERRARR